MRDLDALPLPDFDLFWHEAEYTSPIVPLMELPAFTATFGRGCPYRCTYCSVRHQGSSESPRHKSPARIVEELHRLKAIKGHIGSLMIHDDVHFDHRVTEAWLNAVLAEFGPFPMWLQMRADTICKHPELARLMADAGVAWVSVGAECGSGRMLRYYDKGYDDPEVNVKACDLLHEHGINVWLNYMLGNPTEIHEEMEQTVAMVERIRPAFHSSSVYCSYPGTELDKRCEEEGLKLNSFYSTTHYPWQRTIEGIDYQRMYELQQRALCARGELRRPKSLGG